MNGRRGLELAPLLALKEVLDPPRLDVLVVVPAWLELAIELGALDAFGGSGSASQFRIIRVFKVTRRAMR